MGCSVMFISQFSPRKLDVCHRDKEDERVTLITVHSKILLSADLLKQWFHSSKLFDYKRLFDDVPQPEAGLIPINKIIVGTVQR